MARSKPFRLTAPEPPESELQASCAKALDALLKPPAMWACYPAGHIQLAPAEAARLTRAGLKTGMPDLLLWYQALSFGIELKTRAGKLSKTRMVRTKRGNLRLIEGQQEVFAKLKDAGMAIAVVHGVDEMLLQIRRWGLPLREQVQPYRAVS